MFSLGDIDSVLVVIYLIISLLIGLYTGVNVRSFREYAVGDKKFSTLILAVTISATLMSGSGILNLSTEAYKYGMVMMYAAFGIVISQLLLAYFIAPKMGKFLNKLSAADIMYELYGSMARYITAITSLIFCIGLTAGQMKAMSSVFNYLLVDSPVNATLISSAIIIFYSALGGVRSVTFTDVIQFAALAVSIPMIVNIGLKLVDGYSGLYSSIPREKLMLPSDPIILANFINLFLFFAIPIAMPPFVQRMLMAKDITQIANSMKTTAIIMIFFIIFSSILGFVAYSLDDELMPSSALMLIIDQYMPIGFKGIAVIGMVAIIMSTADSMINCGSVTIVNDFLKPLGFISKKSALNSSMIMTVVIGSFSVVAAISFDSILGVVLFAQNFYAPIAGVPLMLGILGFVTDVKICLIGMFTSLITVLIWNSFDLMNELYISSQLAAILVNLIVLIGLNMLINEGKFSSQDN